MCGTHGVVLLDLKCVFELLLTGTPLRSPPLQGHPGHPCPDQPRWQRQSGQSAHGVKHHLRAEAAAKAKLTFLCFSGVFEKRQDETVRRDLPKRQRRNTEVSDS